MNGVPGAGELLLDMLSDLIHDITYTAPTLPQVTTIDREGSQCSTAEMQAV